jgi:hypothetical protein
MKNSRQITYGGFDFKRSIPQYRARDWLIRLQLSLHASVGMTASKIVAQAPFSMIECMIRHFQEEEVLAL